MLGLCIASGFFYCLSNNFLSVLLNTNGLELLSSELHLMHAKFQPMLYA